MTMKPKTTNYTFLPPFLIISNTAVSIRFLVMNPIYPKLSRSFGEQKNFEPHLKLFKKKKNPHPTTVFFLYLATFPLRPPTHVTSETAFIRVQDAAHGLVLGSEENWEFQHIVIWYVQFFTPSDTPIPHPVHILYPDISRSPLQKLWFG